MTVKAEQKVAVNTRLSSKTHPNRKGRVTEIHDDRILVYWYDTQRVTSVGMQRIVRYKLEGNPHDRIQH